MRPDPYIAADVSRMMEDNEDHSLEFAPEAGITIETAGKRKARIDLAKSEAAMTKAGVDDFFRNLRADAALLYLEALRLEKMYRVSLNSYNTMKQLSTADSIRFRLGTIMEIDATQSRVEAGILNNESALAFSRWQNALVQLSVMAGKPFGDTLIISTDLKNDSCRYFDIEMLTIRALEKRSDLLAAGFEKEAAENALRLARRNRISGNKESPHRPSCTADVFVWKGIDGAGRGEYTILN